MAYSAASRTANESDWWFADKPMLGSNSGTPDKLADSQWSATGTATFASADITDSDGPVSRSLDGLPALVTEPASAQTSFSVLYDFGATGLLEFDFIGLLYHNLHSEGVTGVEVEIADDNAFSVNLVTVSVGNPQTLLDGDTRMLFTDLGSSLGGNIRFSSARYIRLSLEKGSNFEPFIGQFILGRRRQLRWNPDRPFDPDHRESSRDVYTSPNGVITGYNNFGDRHVVDAKWMFDQDADRADLKAFWAEHNYGRRPFFWSYNPYTEADQWLFLTHQEQNPQLRLPKVGPNAFTFDIHGHEQGPENVYLDREG